MAWAAEDLIRRMAEGDADACGRFYERYASLVYPLIVRIVQDFADAADVLQEVFWEAWQAAASYDSTRGSPEAWIVVRARTRAIDRVRAVRRRAHTRRRRPRPSAGSGLRPPTPCGHSLYAPPSIRRAALARR